MLKLNFTFLYPTGNSKCFWGPNESTLGFKWKCTRVNWCSIRWPLVHFHLNRSGLSFKPKKHFEMTPGPSFQCKKKIGYFLFLGKIHQYVYVSIMKPFFYVGLPLRRYSNVKGWGLVKGGSTTPASSAKLYNTVESRERVCCRQVAPISHLGSH